MINEELIKLYVEFIDWAETEKDLIHLESMEALASEDIHYGIKMQYFESETAAFELFEKAYKELNFMAFSIGEPVEFYEDEFKGTIERMERELNTLPKNKKYPDFFLLRKTYKLLMESVRELELYRRALSHVFNERGFDA